MTTDTNAREEQQMSNELSSAEVSADPPIDLEILTAAWAATTGCGIDQIRAALVAALPALRRQIAEEIAAWAEDLAAGVINRDKPYNQGFIHASETLARHAHEIATKEAS